MRKLIVVFVVFGIMFPLSLMAQKQTVKVANATKNLITVDGVSVAARARQDVQVNVSNKTATFTLYYYEGVTKNGPIEMEQVVVNGQVLVKDFKGSPGVASSSTKAETVATEKISKPASKTESYTPPPASRSMSSFVGPSVEVVPKNGIDQKIFIPTGQLNGLSLDVGQTSSIKKSLLIGPIDFPVMMYSKDSANLQTVNWGIFYGLITEGQTELEIKAEDLNMANSGDVINKVIRSEFPTNFVVRDGKQKGEVFSPGKPKKAELYKGWNIWSIEFMTNGMPTRAYILFLVDDQRNSLTMRGKKTSDEVNVSGDNIIMGASGR